MRCQLLCRKMSDYGISVEPYDICMLGGFATADINWIIFVDLLTAYCWKYFFSFFVWFFFFSFFWTGRVRITADLTDLGCASAGCCRSFIITGHYVDFFPIREAPWECPHGTILYSTLLAVYFACHTVISGGWIMTSIFAMLCGLGLYQDKTG